MTCEDKIWFEDIKQLFCSFNLIPNNTLSFKKNLNIISRFTLIFCVIIFYFNPIISIITLFLSYLIIFLFYFVLNSLPFSSFIEERNNISNQQ